MGIVTLTPSVDHGDNSPRREPLHVPGTESNGGPSLGAWRVFA